MFSNLDAFYFSYLFSQARISITMLKGSGGSRHQCLVPGHSGEGHLVFAIKYDGNLSFILMSFVCLRKFCDSTFTVCSTSPLSKWFYLLKHICFPLMAPNSSSTQDITQNIQKFAVAPSQGNEWRQNNVDTVSQSYKIPVPKEGKPFVLFCLLIF